MLPVTRTPISGYLKVSIATKWQTYGIEYDGPLTDIETDNNVVVPESQIQLTDHQL